MRVNQTDFLLNRLEARLKITRKNISLCTDEESIAKCSATIKILKEVIGEIKTTSFYIKQEIKYEKR